MHRFTTANITANIATVSVALLVALIPTVSRAEPRLASPRGHSAAQIGDKWIEADYGRPLLRGRTVIFGAGATYGNMVKGGAPVWRLGANQTTRLKTELPLTIGGKRLAAGVYDLFVDFKDGTWTLIVSTQPTLENYAPGVKDKIWGAYGYDAKFDVARAPMVMGKSEPAIEQFTIGFVDMTGNGGKLQLGWEHTLATIDFVVAK